MSLLDFFNDKPLARRHLFTPHLIDVGQLSDDVISHHGLIAPAEFLFKRALGRGIGRKHIKSLINLNILYYQKCCYNKPCIVLSNTIFCKHWKRSYEPRCGYLESSTKLVFMPKG